MQRWSCPIHNRTLQIVKYIEFVFLGFKVFNSIYYYCVPAEIAQVTYRETTIENNNQVLKL